jgi:hypothetical protein
VYDSRTQSKLVPTVDRVVSVANAIDGTLDVVPPKATGAVLTVTVTETNGNGGFVAVRPAGTDYNGTSSINWFGPNQNLATTVITGQSHSGSQPAHLKPSDIPPAPQNRSTN